MISRIFALSCLLFVFTNPYIQAISTSHAENAAPKTLTPQDSIDLKRVKEYLEGIKTLKGGFLQISPEGKPISGKVYLSKPGRFRFEYDPPETIVMVADGVFFIYIDKQLEQVTHVLLKSTPINFLLQEKVNFEGEITVTEIRRSPGVLQITVKKTKEPETGSITLVFSDNPILLKKWRIVDAQNILTTVNLTGMVTGIDLDPNLFIYTTIKHD